MTQEAVPRDTTAPGTAPPDVLTVRGLTVRYRTAAGVRTAVEDVDLTVPAGRVVAVVGESGSGKSTIAHAVVGLLAANGQIADGTVRFDGEQLVGLGERAWRRIRGRRIGLVPQDPATGLDPVKPVGRQVTEALRVHRLLTGADDRQRAVELLAEAGLPDPEERARQYPHELSGGMRQRVLIAMATAARPRLLVADEPTSALDATVARHILDHLGSVVARHGTSILLVTHDLGVVADRSDDVVVVAGGRVMEAGPTASVLADPQHPYTRRLLDDVPAVASGPVGPDREERPAERPVLRIDDLRRTFPVRGGGRRSAGRVAVDGVSLELFRGRTLGLVGESGSGKTTLARLVLGLDRPTSGSVRLDDEDVTAAGPDALRRLHRRIQLVYQNPYSSLNPRFTVGDAVGEPLRNVRGLGAVERARRVRELLDGVALPAGTAERRVVELSGGQRQRVAIARALAPDPDVLVCDEPVSALDVTVQAQILELLAGLQAERGLSYLFISHDLAVVRQVSDRIAVLRSGRIVEEGPARQIFDAPEHPYTAELLAAVPGRSGAGDG